MLANFLSDLPDKDKGDALCQLFAFPQLTTQISSLSLELHLMT
jgi:hypothetical protein